MIEHLNIEIVPTSFAGTTDRELKIQVTMSNRPSYGSIRIVRQDDLVSFFDQIFEEAKQEIKKAMQGEQ